MKEASAVSSSWRAEVSLDAYLQTHGIVGLQGIDTRALTRHLRDQGSQDGIIASGDLDEARLRERARTLPGLVGRDLVREVTSTAPFAWTVAAGIWGAATWRRRRSRCRVVAYDAGIKLNILRQLASVGCEVTVVPADHARRGGARGASPTASSCPTALAIPKPSRISSSRSARCSAGYRSSASAWATRSSAWPPGDGPTSCRSVTTGPITRSRTSPPAGSRSPSQNHGFAVDPASVSAPGGSRPTSTSTTAPARGCVIATGRCSPCSTTRRRRRDRTTPTTSSTALRT